MTDSTRPSSSLLGFLYRNSTSVSAALSSLVSTVVGFPLDSIKTRLQTFQYPSIAHCIRQTHAQEGFPGFFRGVTVPLASVAIARTTSFSIYESSKSSCLQSVYPTLDKKQRNQQVSLPCFFVSGLMAGAVTGTIFCPFELTKIASQIDLLMQQSSLAHPKVYRPRGSFQSMLSIFRSKGLLGLYSGFGYHIARDSLGTAFYFTIYESTKRYLTPKGHDPGPLEYAISGSLCGALSWLIVFPIDTAKSMMQRDILSNAPTPRHITDFNWASRIMYRGISVSLLRSALINGVNFTIYESLKRLLERS